MDIKTSNDVEAKIAFDNISRIANLESRINKLSYIPIAILICALFYAGLDMFLDIEMSVQGAVILLGGFVACMGNASMQHAKYIAELAELKRQANHT